MDIADIGSNVTEKMTEAAVAAVRAAASRPQYFFRGRCYCCDIKIEVGSFCDAECREEYENLKKRLNQQRR